MLEAESDDRRNQRRGIGSSPDAVGRRSGRASASETGTDPIREGEADRPHVVHREVDADCDELTRL